MPDVTEEIAAAAGGVVPLARLQASSGPFVPADHPGFQPVAETDAAALTASLTDALLRYDAATAGDPTSNPVLLLALDLSRRLASGELTYSALEQLTQYLTADGFLDRATRLRRYLGETDAEANEARLRTLFRRLAEPKHTGSAEPVPFEDFRERIEAELFGLVITAHPTFSLSGDLMHALGTLATGRADDGSPIDRKMASELLAKAARAEHKPDADMSLVREHTLSTAAIEHIQAAIRRACGIVFDVAHELYPDRCWELQPRLVTVATWVGYDLDGRSDIRWSDTLHKRLRVQRIQLERYLADVRALRDMTDRDTADLRDTLDLMESRLALSINQIGDEIGTFAAVDPGMPDDRARVRATAQRMFQGMEMRLTNSGTVIAMIDRAVERAAARPSATALVRRLCVLRAELANHGLGLAHTHVRINATQVHNAIRKAVGLVADPNDPRYRVSYLDRITQLLDQVEPVQINFGSVIGERTSVKQLFMVVAQMLKYSDHTAPVRFLIAESESAFTVLTALYFARLFGVDRRVDISPLFETEKALEVGSRVIEQLLENRHYRAYVQARGRLAVQTGYSDAGRYLGQTAAAASIERLRLRLIRALAKHGLSGVQLLVFDTHGESIGRGAHPASFEERLRYIDTPATRAVMAEHGIGFKQEVSFQGGDGYLYFVNETGAFAVITRILEHVLEDDAPVDDPFYEENAYIREFFTTVKEFQVDLMDDHNYGVLLSAFGASLLFQSGSRALKRQHEDPTEIDQAHASQFRAIPHNAVLMQLGLLANSIGGVGAAIAKDPAKFRALYGRSARMRQLLGIAEYGLNVSNANVMKAYLTMRDPGYWITRAGAADTADQAEDMLTIADYLEIGGLHERQNKVFRVLHRDFTTLTAQLAELAGDGGPSGCARLVTPGTREALCLLHAVRLAVIQELFLLAVKIPDFSSRHAATRKQLIARLLHLDVPGVVSLLEEIFPETESTADLEDFGEPTDYRSDDSQSYHYENEQLFKPMRGLYRLVQRVSTAVAHRVGFFG